jgi:hypothetical protein
VVAGAAAAASGAATDAATDAASGAATDAATKKESASRCDALVAFVQDGVEDWVEAERQRALKATDALLRGRAKPKPQQSSRRGVAAGPQ